VTLHAPGQLVIYPILDLRIRGKDLKRYLFLLEQVAIDFLREFDILADRILGKTGAWVGDHKVASIGIGVKKWVSFHGLAINLNTDLKLFELIKPCGLDVEMTSVAHLRKAPVDLSAAKTVSKKVLENILRLESCHV
jgi:lipoate-protein ligase B